MEHSFWEAFCYHFAMDYDNFKIFFYKWFTIRGIVKQINLDIPFTPRIYISVPIVKNNGILIHPLSVDSELTPSSIDEIDVLYEGSLCSDSSLSCDDDLRNLNINHEGNRITPDIVRTIAKNYGSKLYKSDSFRSLAESENDPGFQSDSSVNTNTFKKLEELQGQFAKMQIDIANLVQLHSFHDSNRTLEIVSSFTPIMSSSPAIKSRLEFVMPPPPPPPPCLPPPPPTPSNPISWKTGLTRKEANPMLDSRKDGMPDMTEILKEISSVKLRPVKPINIDQAYSSELSFVPRIPLRPVSRNESVIASALRERFNQFRMIGDSNESSIAEISDDWTEDDDLSTVGLLGNSINAGRALLRKVDRSKLPVAVSKDFMDELSP